MKNPDIGDVMNKFEVLGIVGEGKPFAPEQTGLGVSRGGHGGGRAAGLSASSCVS